MDMLQHLTNCRFNIIIIINMIKHNKQITRKPKHHLQGNAIETQISPIWDGWSTPTYCQLQSHVTQKLGQKSKIRQW